MNAGILPLLDEEHASFITAAGMSINAASSGAERFANLARCLGCRVDARRRRVTLILAATPARAFLADIAENGRIAAVFCEPLSHRTVQLKGDDARQEAFLRRDISLVQRFRETFADKLLPFGEPREFSLALLAAPDSDLVAVSFTPRAAFSQTPGPHAGAPLAVPS